MKIRNLKIEYLMIGILITYIPFHLFEESLGNFPAWMQAHHWMLNRLSLRSLIFKSLPGFTLVFY